MKSDSFELPEATSGIRDYTKSSNCDTELSILSRHYGIPISAIKGLVGKTEKETHTNLCQFESAMIKLLLYKHANLDGSTLAIVDADTLYRQLGHPLYGYNVIGNRIVMDSGQTVVVELIHKQIGFQKKSYSEILRDVNRHTGWGVEDIKTIAVEIWKII